MKIEPLNKNVDEAMPTIETPIEEKPEISWDEFWDEVFNRAMKILKDSNCSAFKLTLVYQAKNLVKVNNCLKWFKPDREYDEIRVFSFTNLYDEKTHKLVRVISPQLHTEIKNGN